MEPYRQITTGDLKDVAETLRDIIRKRFLDIDEHRAELDGGTP